MDALTGERTAAPSNNLPLQLSSFVGRERELAEVEGLLAHRRLLTLTGPGGAGKTRLALAVAADLLGEYKDGVWLAELAPLSDPNFVAQVVASALGVREQPDRPLTETLSDDIGNKKMLLVLDNCEHLLEACAELAEALLRSCRGLRIVATSREAIGIIGEGVWPVPPLSLPDPRRLPEVGALPRYESVSLFADRAAAADPAFVLTERNAGAVAQICYRLDGIPLAIELAAARGKVLSVEQISARLDDRFALLTGGGRTALAHQRTLRAAMDWSHELLTLEERMLLRRLAVFAGGFTLEAAEAVGVEGFGEELEKDGVLDLLSHLVDKSLVLVEEQDGVARYRLLETIRQYGWEKLQESGEAKISRRRHARFFLTFAEEAEPESQGALLERLEQEHDNLRAALGWSLESGGEVELGLRLGGALGGFWHVRGYLSEGSRWLERGLTKNSSGVSPPSVRAKALSRAGWIAIFQGDGRAMDLLEESVSLYRELGDKTGLASSLANLGWAVASLQIDKWRLPALVEEAEALRREPLDRRLITHLLHFLAMAAMGENDFERAAALVEENLALLRELGDVRGIIIDTNGLAMIALLRGDHARAAKLFGENMHRSRQLGDKVGTSYSLLGFAGVASSVGQAIRAARLWGAAEIQREALSLLFSPVERSHYEPYIGAARARLDEASWEAAWAEGREMTLEQAVEYALEPQEPSNPTTYPAGLSAREVEVLGLVARGMTNAQVAELLFISPNTVNKHLNSIYHKLGVTSRTAATRFASDHNLI